MTLVKLQLPLAVFNETPKAFLYTKDRTFEMLCPISEDIRERMDGRFKAFFHVDLSQGEPILLDEVEDQGW